jgi:hypothetical protein
MVSSGSEQGLVANYCEQGDQPRGSIKDVEIPAFLSNCFVTRVLFHEVQLLRNNV